MIMTWKGVSAVLEVFHFFFFLDIVCVQFVKIYPVVCLQYGYYSACLLYFDNK